MKHCAILEQASKAADSFADADIFNQMVRGQQLWSLLSTQAAMNVKGAYHARGRLSSFPQFSEWFGKYSSRNKRRRLLSELSLHTALAAGKKMTGRALRLDVLVPLRNRLKGLLQQNDIDGAIAMLDSYGISREDFIESMPEFTLGQEKGDELKDISTKVKSAFTRKYNSMSHSSSGLHLLADVKVKRKKKTKQSGNVNDEYESDAEEEDIDLSKFRPKKKKKRTKSKAKTKTKTKTKTKEKSKYF